MFEDNKKELDNLMGQFHNDQDGLDQKKQAERDAQRQFIEQFDKVKHEVVWPVIVDIGNQLNTYGHDYHVSEEEEFTDATASYYPASITLNLYPATLDKSFHKPESTPYIQFVANKYAKKVGIMVSTMMPGEGGVIGSHGEYDISRITADFVEKEIINVLKNTLLLHKAN